MTEVPDPRFSLANERTYLAWIRTSLALVAVGLGVWFAGWVVRSLVADDVKVDHSVFRASIAYLTLLILTMLIDLAIPWGTT